jgi:hypothetical protein
MSGVCIVSNVSGLDLVYSFASNGSQTFWASLFPTGFRGSLAPRGPGGTCATAAEVECVSGTATGPRTSLDAEGRYSSSSPSASASPSPRERTALSAFSSAQKTDRTALSAFSSAQKTASRFP